MDWPNLLSCVHVAIGLAVILLIGFLGRLVARGLRQPAVIGEIGFGVLAGPAVAAIAGVGGMPALLPPEVLIPLREFGNAGLAWFLVGVARQLRVGVVDFRDRAALPSVVAVAVGSFVLPLALGAGFGAWVLWSGEPALRGTAPAPAVVVLLAVATSVTAVPVLARILADRGILGSDAGVLSLVAAAFIDAVAWVLLAVAIGLAARSGAGAIRAIVVLVMGAFLAWLGHRLLRTDLVSRLAAQWPVLVGILVGVAALAASSAAHRWGLTAVFGALLVGLALPVGDAAPWARVVTWVARVGRWLVPVFFVITGVDLLTGGAGAMPWRAVGLVVLLAIAGKMIGGYVGARATGQPRRTGLHVAVLMNTRGLTEIVVLQAGYSAGILTPSLYLAFVVMTLITTGSTGPLLSLIGRMTPGAARAPKHG